MPRRPRAALFAGLVALIVGIVGLVLVAPVLAASGPSTGTPAGAVGMTGMAGMRGGPVAPGATPIGIELAAANARASIASLGDSNLELSEVMEFSANYYAQAIERNTGIHAFELLIDKYTGTVFPEMGPNMVWNTKYGVMGGMMRWQGFGAGSAAEMPIGPAQVQQNARQYLRTQGLNLDVGEPDRFYGYYTLHTLRDRQIEGMISVNGETGVVWYHTWHGPFVREVEFRT
ncbi:MAG TPA: hypothetical protein VNL16_18675 [Chloroflexota bacterium]|nr:hypothetical protein [Chloroflexota bacterium]